MARFRTLKYYEEDEIGYIVINMPPANKMIPEFILEFYQLVEDIITKTKVRAMILMGEGRNFSSGADIDKLTDFIIRTSNEEESNIPNWYVKSKKAFVSLSELSIPVISIIRGCCIGSGFELAIHGHILICEKGALIGSPECTFGLMPGMNGTIKSFNEMGYRKALNYFLSGELTCVELNEEYPFIDIVVPKKTGLDLAIEFIHSLTKQDSYSKEEVNKLFASYVSKNKRRIN